MKVLFICSGNVGRSQMAEAYYNYFIDSSDATSAGCDPAMPVKWQHPAPETAQVMAENGIDVSEKQVKTVTEQMVILADRIIVLCKRDECPQFVLEHHSISFWEIEDPYQCSVETFRKVRDVIKDLILELVKK